MPKPNVFHWKPKFREAVTRTFTDDVNGQPEQFTFTLWMMTDPEEMQALAASEQYVARFIGSDDEEAEVKDFYPVGGEAITVTEKAILLSCFIHYAQPPFVKTEDRWSIEELIALRSRASQKFRRDLNAFFNEVNGKKAKDKKFEALAQNPPGGSMSTCSELPFEESAPTPDRPTKPIPSSGASTNGLDNCLPSPLMARK